VVLLEAGLNQEALASSSSSTSFSSFSSLSALDAKNERKLTTYLQYLQDIMTHHVLKNKRGVNMSLS
jgi:hypothetical protein